MASLMKSAIKVDLRTNARDFVGVSMNDMPVLDRANLNDKRLRRVFGRLLGHAEREGDTISFYILNDDESCPHSIECEPATPDDIARTPSLNKDLLQLRTKLEESRRNLDFKEFYRHFEELITLSQESQSAHFWKWRLHKRDHWKLVWFWGYAPRHSEPCSPAICTNPQCECLFLRRGGSNTCPVCMGAGTSSKIIENGQMNRDAVSLSSNQRILLVATSAGLLTVLLLALLLYTFFSIREYSKHRIAGTVSTGGSDQPPKQEDLHSITTSIAPGNLPLQKSNSSNNQEGDNLISGTPGNNSPEEHKETQNKIDNNKDNQLAKRDHSKNALSGTSSIVIGPDDLVPVSGSLRSTIIDCPPNNTTDGLAVSGTGTVVISQTPDPVGVINGQSRKATGNQEPSAGGPRDGSPTGEKPEEISRKGKQAGINSAGGNEPVNGPANPTFREPVKEDENANVTIFGVSPDRNGKIAVKDKTKEKNSDAENAFQIKDVIRGNGSREFSIVLQGKIPSAPHYDFRLSSLTTPELRPWVSGELRDGLLHIELTGPRMAVMPDDHIYTIQIERRDRTTKKIDKIDYRFKLEFSANSVR